ncbi:MAG: ATP-dependent RecD-like DNA helicase, partial [bacterium]
MNSISLSGTVETVIYENDENGFHVLRVDTEEEGTITAVGKLSSVDPGHPIEIEGTWGDHARYGRQFEIERLQFRKPNSLEDIQAYLASDLITGIGPSLAERITDKFGDETLDIMDNDIERLKEVSGIGDSTFESIKEQWDEHRDQRETMIQLQGLGISSAYARKLYDRYGDDAPSIVEEDPYRLAREVEGIGFKVADRIARQSRDTVSGQARMEAALEYVLDQAGQEGHLYLPEPELIQRAADMVEAPPEKVQKTIQDLGDRGRLTVRDVRGTIRVFLPYHDQLEDRVASNLMRLRERESTLIDELSETDESVEDLIEDVVDREDITYNSDQEQAIRNVLEENVFIVTGGPGTGKTTVVQGILDLLERTGKSIELAAPTGRAAQRLGEATGRGASTIHRLLGYQPPNIFRYKEDNKLPVDALIVDEMSMVDAWLMDHLLQALADDTVLIMVGDADQLPSVGPGNVLNDLIDSEELPVVELTEIFRQARQSRIVMNAHRINRGKKPELDNDPDGDFFFIEEDDPARALETVEDLAENRLPEHYGLDPFEDLQVLSPMYDGTCGVTNLNISLQRRLNDWPGRQKQLREAETKHVYHAGDKVMQLTNNYDKDVFNGDIGRVKNVKESEQQITVEFPGTGTITYEGVERRELTLAYAATIHKSQGSEYPGIVLVLLKQHYVMLKRNLLYTALTRARDLAVLVGSRQAVHMAMDTDDQSTRYTSLDERLRNVNG